MSGEDQDGRGEAEPDLRLHVHALEWKVKDLARQNYELSALLHESQETLHAVYGSRGWRLLEALRRRARGKP